MQQENCSGTNKSSSSSLLQRRRSRNSVSFAENLILDIPAAVSTSITVDQPNILSEPTLPRIETSEAMAAGEELFENFVIDEIRDLENVDQRIRCRLVDQASQAMPINPEHINRRNEWIRAGIELRNLADDFRNSQERQNVLQQANHVPIESISFVDFEGLLQELFSQGAISRERIVVLFYFCSDVAIRTLRFQGQYLFTQFINWSLDFIRQRVVSWVVQQGGWLQVLGNQIERPLRYALFTASVAVVGIAIWSLVKRNN